MIGGDGFVPLVVGRFGRKCAMRSESSEKEFASLRIPIQNGEGKMSEYQYYEFSAVDRPLTTEQMRELRALSSRAEISATRFMNFYNWGDFRGDPRELMEKYFDAFLYVANWGTRRLMFRFQATAFPARIAAPYCGSEDVSVSTAGDVTLLEFCRHEEISDWVEGEGWLPSLLPVRDDLLQGDLRSLYLGWLLSAQTGALEEDESEPPLPPGLDDLSSPLEAFVDLFNIDRDLVCAAAAGRPDPGLRPLSSEEAAAWLGTLPGATKDQLLLRLISGDRTLTRGELLRAFQAQHSHSANSKDQEYNEPAPGRRTVRKLLAEAKRHVERRRIEEAERKARERKRQLEEEAKKRARYLDGLEGREDSLWREVEELVQARQTSGYDRVAERLKDLGELAARKRQTEAFIRSVDDLKRRHPKKVALQRRLNEVVKRASLPEASPPRWADPPREDR